MIDARFSRKAFEESTDPEALAAALQREVALAIEPQVKAAVEAVIEQLNDLGHELIDEQRGESDEVCYDTPEGAPVRLYVCHDTTVSAGTRRSRRV